MIRHIESKDNKYVKLIKSLSMKKYREKNRLFLAEGVRIVRDALQNSDCAIEFLVFSDSFFRKNQSFVSEFSSEERLALVISDSIFDTLCDTENSQGALAAVRMPNIAANLKNSRFVLILDGVSEPGNMGAIIRTAEASGVDIIFTIGDCVDVYNPKSVRSTMGSVFRMPIVRRENCAELTEELKSNGFAVCASSLAAEQSIYDVPNTAKIALAIGSEARGISSELEAAADMLFKIPMRGKAESLNASVAAGIAMYELGRRAL